ncbi:WD40 repeat-like protein [Rhizoctonia solani]|uniref:WD40 repeat-like protein n=1 Tax=Rhizoctonia solani TaxID=456999 RepID=A0A8H7ILQ1_9AGAM|nr:WD40 repeat-like protein [Rhizoctonia solani]
MNRVGASRMGSSHLQRPTSSTSAINVKREEIIIDSDSEPDVIMLDGDSDSDIEFVGVVGKQNRTLDNGKSIPILNGTSATSIIPLDTHSITQDLGVDTDEESLPEGFELWDPTTPVRSTVPAVAPNHEIIQNEQPEMVWRPPVMSWMHEECTSSRSAGAFIETRVNFNQPRSSRPANVIANSLASQGHLGREAVKYMETAVLYSRPMTRIPGMNAPRGAVNYIAQSKGYVAVGRTYEESAAYDGGGLVLWKVKDQRARDLPAHITESRTRRSDCDMPEPGRRQHSIVTLSFDPTNHLSLLSAGHDGTIQHWYIDEDEDTVEYVGTAPVKEPGCMEFHPGGGVVAVGCRRGLKLFATGGLLEKKYHWYLKKKGQNIVNASWGAGRSRDSVVCGAQADDGIDGKLVLIDGQVGQCLVSTDSESCCTVSVDPIGTRTAFTGSGRGGNPKRFVLRLYDPQRMGWKRIAEIGIPSSKSEVDSEIIDSAWSPDGIQLACSRADNSVNVLDTRWLGQKGCMRVFRHDIDQSPVTSADSFGVQGVVWFGSETLVSGGADHCVRVWDTRRSESGRVIARLGGGIGCLIGSEDPQLFPLIAGDLLGNVHYLPNPQLVRET